LTNTSSKGRSELRRGLAERKKTLKNFLFGEIAVYLGPGGGKGGGQI